MKHTGLLTIKKALFFVILILFSFNQIFAQLAGSYIVDPGGDGNYTSLAEAVNDLNAKGMSAEVILKLKPGTYNEKAVLNSVNGNSPEKRIIIESFSGNNDDVVITYSDNDNDASNYVIRLENIKGAIIRNITFITTEASSSYGRVIELTGFTENVIIEGSRFFGNRNSSAIVFGAEAGGLNFFTQDSNRTSYGQEQRIQTFFPGRRFGKILYKRECLPQKYRHRIQSIHRL